MLSPRTPVTREILNVSRRITFLLQTAENIIISLRI